MAKKSFKTGFSIQGFDAAHYRQTQEYLTAIDAIYQQAINDFAMLGDRITIDPNNPFSLSDYPSANAKAQQIVNNLATRMQAVVINGSKREWLYACKKNDEFLNHILNTSKISKKLLQKYQDRNLDALDAFQKRKVDGLDLSKRIWRYADQFKTQMELGLDIGLGEGKSAQVLSKELRGYLVDPDKLFRRVRDKHGNLVLSKNAKAFNPGQGKYRSSYKNAMRLTRSEINMAYREADHLRWQKLDFVVGFEVKVSNKHESFLVEWEKSNPGKVEICDQLKGRYPKTFIFKGWHPQCMCYAVPILMDADEYNTDELNELRAAVRGEEYKKFTSRNTVTEMPRGFNDWVLSNAERSQGWKSQPYFVRDNFKGGVLVGGFVKPMKIAPPVSVSSNQPKEDIQVSAMMPNQFTPKSEYLLGENYSFDKKFFNLLDPNKPIRLTISPKGEGAYFSVGRVHLSNSKRNENSAWHKKAVVYHEYGHAIDWQRGLKLSPDLANLRAKQITWLRQKDTFTVWNRQYDYATSKYVNAKLTTKMSRVAYIDHKLKDLSSKIYHMKAETFTKMGITKWDVLEQIGSTRDTIKSLVVSYGDGHTTRYFKTVGMKEAEYLAHAFENAFLGNVVFKKYMPSIYEEMIEFIRTLK
jgi:hypothetical protein